MAGLLNLVPRYLPRYGMAPEWARATRPLVALFTGITFLVTIIFDANVDAQGGAYATGVLVLMSSAALAVAITAWRQRQPLGPVRADHARLRLHDASPTSSSVPKASRSPRVFILTIIVTSLVSRALRSTELRVGGIDPTSWPRRFIAAAASAGEALRIIANRPRTGARRGVRGASSAKRSDAHHMPADDPVLFLESARATRRSSARCCACKARTSAAIACSAARARRFPTRLPRCCSTFATARAHSARLLRMDRRQPDHVSAEVPGVRRRRHRAGHAAKSCVSGADPLRRPRVHVG